MGALVLWLDVEFVAPFVKLHLLRAVCTVYIDVS